MKKKKATLNDQPTIGPTSNFTVKGSAPDVSPGYLDAKVDGTSIKVISNKLTATIQQSSEWYTPAYTGLTYIDANHFSVDGNASSIFNKNQRIKATVTAGTIIGTILWVTVAGAETTVTVTWDSGVLDSGLSAVLLSILTNPAMPVPKYTVKNSSYVLTNADVNQSFGMYASDPSTFTIPAPTPFFTSGTWIRFVNENTATLTINGSTNLGSSVTLNKGDVLFIVSDNNHWFASKTPALNYSVMADSSDTSPGYLDAKVDNSTIKVTNHQLVSTYKTNATVWSSPTLSGLAYVSSNSFSVSGDLSSLFKINTRIRASFSSGVPIIGVVLLSSFGSGVTTVTCLWETGSLTATLNLVEISILNPHEIPSMLSTVNTSSQVLGVQSINSSFTMNSSTPQTYTLPVASTIPAGSFFVLSNAGSGLLTVIGTVSGITNPYLTQNQMSYIVLGGDGQYRGMGTPTFMVLADPYAAGSELPGFLKDKVDGVTITVADHKLVAIGGGSSGDSYTVKASPSDTPGFLDDKVDGITVQVINNELVCTAQADTYRVKSNQADATPGFLADKVDGSSLLVNPVSGIMSATAVSDTYMVKVNAGDTVGYLTDKVDGSTVKILGNKLFAPNQDSFKVEASSGDSTPGFLSDKVDNTSIKIGTTGGNLNKLYATAVSDTYTVKASTDDISPGCLDAKVDGSTIQVQGGKLVAVSSGATYTVKGNAADPLPGFLSDKVDGTTITVGASGKLSAISGDIDSFTVKTYNTDTTGGFLSQKVDGVSVVIDTNGNLKAPAISDTYMVKGNPGDVSPGFLADKVDGTTIQVGADNKLMSPWQESFTVKASTSDATGGFLDAKVDGTSIKVGTSGGTLNKLYSTAVSDTYMVKFGSTDSADFLSNKIDGTSIIVDVNGDLKATAISDTFMVKAAGGFSPEYLDAIVDGVTIQINGGKLVATSGSTDTYMVKSTGADVPGFLTDKVDGSTIKVVGDQMVAQYLPESHTVLASSSDQTAGFLDAKVDGTTISVVNNKISSFGKVKSRDTDTTPDYLVNKVDGYSIKVDAVTGDMYAVNQDSFTVKSFSGDPHPGFLTNKVDGNSIKVDAVTGTMSATAVSDTYMIKFSPTDNADYLGVKIDGSTIQVDSLTGKLKATAVSDTYKIKSFATDVSGYLNSKVDGTTIVVSETTGIMSSTVIDHYTVKATQADTPGFLDAKVDGTSMKVVNGKLQATAISDTYKVSMNSVDPPDYLGTKVDGETITFNSNGKLQASILSGPIPNYTHNEPIYTVPLSQLQGIHSMINTDPFTSPRITLPTLGTLLGSWVMIWNEMWWSTYRTLPVYPTTVILRYKTLSTFMFINTGAGVTWTMVSVYDPAA